MPEQKVPERNFAPAFVVADTIELIDTMRTHAERLTVDEIALAFVGSPVGDISFAIACLNMLKRSLETAAKIKDK